MASVRSDDFLFLKFTYDSRRAGHAKGVAVAFDEAVDEVHVALGVLGPKYGVFIEEAEVAGDVVVDELGDVGFLCIVLSHVLGHVRASR